jgi:lysine-specific demethylase 8
MRVTGSVERVEGLSPRDFVERYEPSDLPLVIASGAADWVAVARWNAEYLKALIGSVTLHHKLSATHQHPNFHAGTLAETFARGESTVSELIDAVTTGPEPERAKRLFTGDEQFLLRRRDGQTTLDPGLAPRYRDVELPSYVPRERLYTVWAWFSGRGVRSWLHYDNNGCHNLNAQITGEKECVLFSPDQIERLHPFEPGGPNPAHNCSAVDVEAPDLERYPLFSDATALFATLGAGDLLFIPAWWSHSFLHTGELNANVNFWWLPDHPRDNAVARREAAMARRSP